MRPWFIATITSLLCAVGLQAIAQPLADKLPDDTILYVGWQGVTTLPGYGDSHLKAILDNSNIPQFFNDFLPQLAQFAASKDRAFRDSLPVIEAVVKPLWNYPSAIYFGGVDMPAGGRGEPMPRLAVLINAGGEAENVQRNIAAVIEKLHDAPLVTEVKDGLVVVAVGKALPDSLKASLGGGKTLAADPSFKASMDQLVKQPGFAMYVNFAEIWALIGHVAPPPGQAKLAQVSEMLGLQSLKSLSIASGFDGKDWVNSAFVACPSPRSGLFKAIEKAPISDDFLKMVPQNSLSMAAGRFRPGALLDAARAVWPMFGNEAPPLDQALQQVNQVLGFDVDKDFLAAFGDEWAIYTDPAIGGTGLVGTVLINRTADGAKLEQSLSTLEQKISQFFAENVHEKGMRFDFKTKQFGDLKLHYFAMPFVTPSWAIKDGTLYVGLYPQSIIGATELAAKHGPSIVDNEKFKTLRSRLGDVKATGLTFVDLQRTVPETYGPWVAISRYVGLADIFGVDSPLLMVPPMNVVMENLGPAGSVSWVDDAGFHMRDLSPWPGSEVLGMDPMRVAAMQAPIYAGFLLPALSKARVNANRVHDAANLRQIGMACIMYSNEYRGKMPDDLGQTKEYVAGAEAVYISPLRQGPHPAAPAAPDQVAAWIKENSDYVYKGAGKKLTELGAAGVVAYDKPEILYKNGGMNVLYGDGHVEWVFMGEAQRIINGGGVGGPATP